MSREDSPSGIGGWLILPMLGLIITPFRIAFVLISTYLPIFQEGYWSVLTNPESEHYHALWAPLLIFEILGNAFFLIFAVVLLVLLFTKHRMFPMMMIGFYVLNLVFVVTDYFAADMIPTIAENPDPEGAKEIFRTMIGAAIWIPYFLKSERVKNTFV